MLLLLIWLIIIVAAFGIAWWILSQIPIPPPMRVVVNVVLGIIALIMLLWLAGSVLGGPPSLGHLGR